MQQSTCRSSGIVYLSLRGTLAPQTAGTPGGVYKVRIFLFGGVAPQCNRRCGEAIKPARCIKRAHIRSEEYFVGLNVGLHLKLPSM
jgi:hypothetical protein